MKLQLTPHMSSRYGAKLSTGITSPLLSFTNVPKHVNCMSAMGMSSRKDALQ